MGSERRGQAAALATGDTCPLKQRLTEGGQPCPWQEGAMKGASADPHGWQDRTFSLIFDTLTPLHM